MPKKRIAILGSTGSIGKDLLKIIEKDKNNFEIVLITANKNYKLVIKQAKKFKVKNVIIQNRNSFKVLKKYSKIENINIFNSFNSLDKIFRQKIDYVMSSIVGLEGLYPTMKIIKYTKKIAIANKESIICAWNLIEDELNKNKTEFVPVDSEHFSTWFALTKKTYEEIDKIYLTASGGSLLNVSKKKFNKLSTKEILNHPNWVMGKKITIDSSTLMNKVFEIIEAKKIFNLDYKKLDIIIHPSSYIHSIIKFSNGMIKLIAHDTTMQIPIFNTLYSNNEKKLSTKKVDFDKLNNLNFKKVDQNKFNLVKILKKLPNRDSLFETALVSANDELVNHFLNKKINYVDINKILIKILNKKEFKILKKNLPTSISQVINTSKLVRFKINSLLAKKYEKKKY